MSDIGTLDLIWLIGIVERFESDWRRGQSPRIEAYLDEVEASKRLVLLRELLRIEWEIRVERGESPMVEEYERRFHEHRTLVREVFDRAALPCPRPPRGEGRRSQDDRNLLFGVLALQADLIDSTRFVEACSAWAARKDLTLAQLLVERRWITDEDRAAVEHLLTLKL
jgi:hypothetical protein